MSATRTFSAVLAAGLIALAALHVGRGDVHVVEPVHDLGIMEIVAVDCRDTGDCLPGVDVAASGR